MNGLKTPERIRSELRPIRSEATYREYLGIIDGLVDCAENSKEEELLELVSILVENYEAQHKGLGVSVETLLAV